MVASPSGTDDERAAVSMDGGAAEMTLAYALRASSWRVCIMAAPATKTRMAAKASAGRAIPASADHQPSAGPPRATCAGSYAAPPGPAVTSLWAT